MASDCEHEQFSSTVGIGRLTDEAGLLTGFHASVTIKCVACSQSFVFLGVPMGMNLDGAAVSVDGQELRVAIAPTLDWQPKGRDLGVRGFRVQFTDGKGRGSA